ncbi:MAG: orotidine-5'-phosphate decarboxylase [Spirochaetales bacterium]|nr:orotidine-5'-phosphate decarboxylase [Spirochaetales bacterium]
MKDFFRMLEERIQKKDTLLCVGLDPQDEPAAENSFSTLVSWAEKIISQTREYAACFKPNIAFYEAYGPDGLQALEHIINKLIPDEIPVIVDAKRGDIGNTAVAYAAAIFDRLRADAVTLNPYLGEESVGPFLEYEGRGLFVLCRTSNPGSAVMQEIRVCDPHGIGEYYLRVAREAAGWSDRIGLVVAGNDYDALAKIRKDVPDVWLLAPGIGAQGGRIDQALVAGMRSDGMGILLTISRGITQAADPARAARLAVEEMRRAGEKPAAAHSVGAGSARAQKTPRIKQEAELTQKKRDLISELIHADCFKLGKFTLKSGITSPFYIDLRLIISHPLLLSRVAAAYCSMVKELKFDRLSGIPFAAVPFATLVALMLDKPLVFPRMEIKQHGTKKPVEGEYKAGEKVLLLDDLIATGASKLQAVSILQEQGLKVGDLAVLIERGLTCRAELKQHGIALHSYLHIYDFLTVCRESDKVTEGEYNDILKFLQADKK